MAEPACRQVGGIRADDMFSVYVIKSKRRNYIYVGFSKDLKRRLNEHQKGLNKTTKPYRPFSLIYAEECGSRSDARKREKYLKSGSGREWIRNL